MAANESCRRRTCPAHNGERVGTSAHHRVHLRRARATQGCPAAAGAPAPEARAQQSTGNGEPQEGGIEGLEAEADQQGAFNPETGEINWDCPCLGGMASGPCGDEFKAAFSCFVFSKEEPKGMDCIDNFK